MEYKVGRVTFKKNIIFILIILFGVHSAYARTYKTYAQWEVDAVAVAWLIQKYIDKEANFEIVKKETPIQAEQAVNTPNSRFRRTAKETAFESALRYYKIDSSCTKKIVPLVRVIEMAPWRKSEDMRVLNFEKDVVTKLQEEGIFAVFEYIDHFCEKGQ